MTSILPPLMRDTLVGKRKLEVSAIIMGMERAIGSEKFSSIEENLPSVPLHSTLNERMKISYPI